MCSSKNFRIVLRIVWMFYWKIIINLLVRCQTWTSFTNFLFSLYSNVQYVFHNQHYCQVMNLYCKSGIQILLVQWAYTNEVISVIYLNGSMPAKKRWKGDHLSDNIQSQTGKTLEQGKPEPKQNKISCMMNCLHNLVNYVPPFLFVQHHHNRLIAKTNAKYKKQEIKEQKSVWEASTTETA